MKKKCIFKHLNHTQYGELLILWERFRNGDQLKEHQIHISLPARLWGICSSGTWDRITHTIYILLFLSFSFWQRKSSWVWMRTLYVLRKNSIQNHNFFWEGQLTLKISGYLLFFSVVVRIGGSSIKRRGPSHERCSFKDGGDLESGIWRLERTDLLYVVVFQPRLYEHFWIR